MSMDSFRQRTRHEKDPMTLVDGSTGKDERQAMPLSAPSLTKLEPHEKDDKKESIYKSQRDSDDKVYYWIIVALLTVLSLATRFYCISEGKTVV